MMGKENSTVQMQTMGVAVVVALLVGFLGGVIYSSIHGGGQPAPQTAGAPTGGGQPPPAGIDTQQAGATILALEQKVAANANDAEAWVQLGNIYYDTNNFAKAIEAYNRYLALQPNNANVLTDLGTMYRNNGQTKEAVASFDRAMAVDPKHVQAPINKGVVLMNDLHDYKGAVAVWQKLVDANPSVTAANGMPVSQLIEEAKRRMEAEGH